MDLGFLAAHRDGIILGLDLFGTAIFAITGRASSTHKGTATPVGG